MKKITNLFLLLLMGGMFAQPGEIDKTFNARSGAGFDKKVEAIAEQKDGKILVAGSFSNYAYTSKKGIVRLNTNGTIDTTFAIGSGANSSISSIAVQSDGKIIIAGGFTAFNDIAVNRIARLNADGTLDTTFHSGTGYNSYASIAIQADGKILIGGYFATYDDVAIKNIARLNVEGFLDTTFITGTGVDGSIKKVMVKPTGQIVVLGDFDNYNGIPRKNLAQINVDGTLDSTFIPGSADYGIDCIDFQSDGKLIIGGWFTKFNNIPKKAIVRLNLDGTLDNSFNYINESSGSFTSLKILPNGKILAGGVFTSLSENTKRNLIRINVDGTVDGTFNSGTKETLSISCITTKIDGKILIGGDFTSYNDTLIGRFAQLNADGILDTTVLNPGGFGSGANTSITAMALQTDGKIVISGTFLDSYNGVATSRLIRLNADGTLDTTFKPGQGPNATVNDIAIQPDGKIILAGLFRNYNNTARNRIARINADGSLDDSFNIGKGADGTITQVALQTDGKLLIVGGFKNYNGFPKNYLARLNANGTIDATFYTGAGPEIAPYSITLQTDGKIIIAGHFVTYNSKPKKYLARLNTDGALDTTFNITGISIDWSVERVLIQPDGKLLISGAFSPYLPPPPGMARLNSDGSFDSTFVAKSMIYLNTGTNKYSNPRCMALQSDGKILIGGLFTSYDDVPILNMTRLNSDGTIDKTFIGGVGHTNNKGEGGWVQDIIVQPDGKILIAGSILLYNGIQVGHITRALSDNITLSNSENTSMNKSNVIIYPNPSTGIFNIQSNKSIENAAIIISDLNGRIVHQSKADNLQNKAIDLHHLQKGIYILNVKNATCNYSQKLIKQ